MISEEIVSNLEKEYNAIEDEQRWHVLYHVSEESYMPHFICDHFILIFTVGRCFIVV